MRFWEVSVNWCWYQLLVARSRSLFKLRWWTGFVRSCLGSIQKGLIKEPLQYWYSKKKKMEFQETEKWKGGFLVPGGHFGLSAPHLLLRGKSKCRWSCGGGYCVLVGKIGPRSSCSNSVTVHEFLREGLRRIYLKIHPRHNLRESTPVPFVYAGVGWFIHTHSVVKLILCSNSWY